MTSAKPKHSDAPKARGLGRGLNALFEDEEEAYAPIDDIDDPPGRERRVVGIDEVSPGPQQPRKHFDSQALEELALSIREHGILQPLLVREGSAGYEIIAGERRWRAAQIAQLHEVPVIILDLDDIEALKIALIENLQREDLDPIEEAAGYQKLLDTYGQTQEELAKSVGKSRSHIANMIRLLALPDSVQGQVSEGKLSMGHARTLITAENPEALADEIIRGGLSVRQAEKLAAESSGRVQQERSRKSSGGSGGAPAKKKDADTLALENDMSNMLGMRVAINTTDGASGHVTIEFKSLDQLDEVLHRLAHYPGSRQSG
ncbi:MAG: ParB/RepB/Spo0J family partition protein [Rhodospirillales bacterium]|nr:ParB/RepB/Spo0J family partition protein [Alphaproteobacteria bacterium]MCB9977568.1 ParB/RepB/Spo0J family partition protein [Rhodospirillales bacterium]